MSVIDIGEFRPQGSGDAREFLATKFESEDLMFLAGVWGLFLGVLGYVMIFKP